MNKLQSYEVIIEAIQLVSDMIMSLQASQLIKISPGFHFELPSCHWKLSEIRGLLKYCITSGSSPHHLRLCRKERQRKKYMERHLVSLHGNARYFIASHICSLLEQLKNSRVLTFISK